MRSAVLLGNLHTSDQSEFAFRVSEVGSHELGHVMGFYSHGSGLAIGNWIHNMFSSDLMNEGQNMPKSSSPEKFDMSVPQMRILPQTDH